MRVTVIATLVALALICACQPRLQEAEAAREESEESEASDLDRTVDELFELECEHGMKMYECEECRYEAGVSRAPKELFDQGLMKLARAERRRLSTVRSLNGEIQWDERLVVHLSAPSEGVVRKVNVALGDRVRKGDPLVELDSGTAAEAQAERTDAEQALALARAGLERATALRNERISSEREFLETKREYEGARARAEAARAKAAQLGAGRGSSGRIVLLAPADGRVLFLHAVAGENVGPGEILATIGDNSRLWVTADVYESDLAAVASGQAQGTLGAEVSVRAFPDERFPATVEFVSPAMDETTRTVPLRLVLPNPDGKLLAGMFAQVRLTSESSETATALPEAAVMEDAGRHFVFIHRVGDFYVRRPVKVGRSWEGWVEVLSGVEPDQEVVTEGAFLLKSDVLRSKMGAGCAD